jgi:hypothetical protein
MGMSMIELLKNQKESDHAFRFWVEALLGGSARQDRG